VELPRQHSRYRLKDGRSVIIRPPKSTEVVAMMNFANSLVKEKKTNREMGILLDTIQTEESEGKFLRELMEKVETGDSACWVADVDGAVVGVCNVTRRAPNEVRHTGVLGISILEGYRSLGLGRRMMELSIERAGALGISLIELEVFDTNTRAKKLYESLGFKKTGKIPGRIRRGDRTFDIVTMARTEGK
jgi:ribosomal protein S18 acetylase RimI-like enzyme